MLDIPPPPPTSAGLVGSDDETDVMSDEEANGGGWKLVGGARPQKIGRRRTLTDRHEGKLHPILTSAAGSLTRFPILQYTAL